MGTLRKEDVPMLIKMFRCSEHLLNSRCSIFLSLASQRGVLAASSFTKFPCLMGTGQYVTKILEGLTSTFVANK